MAAEFPLRTDRGIQLGRLAEDRIAVEFPLRTDRGIQLDGSAEDRLAAEGTRQVPAADRQIYTTWQISRGKFQL